MINLYLIALDTGENGFRASAEMRCLQVAVHVHRFYRVWVVEIILLEALLDQFSAAGDIVEQCPDDGELDDELV